MDNYIAAIQEQDMPLSHPSGLCSGSIFVLRYP
jgi:hypothetical protein